MPRVGPNYTLPQPPFVPQTPIASAAMNSDLSDIADALTASLARNGAGGMTAVLPLDNAGFNYLTDPNTGMRRTAADEQAIVCGGTLVITITPDGGEVDGDLDVTGDITKNGTPILPVGLGPLPWSGLTAPPGWVLARGQALLRADYPDLWAFAQTQIAGGSTLYTNGNGTTTFTVPDTTGRVPAGVDPTQSRLTPTYFTDSDILGSTGGGDSKDIAVGNLPPYTPSGTVTGVTVASTSNLVQVNAAGNVTPQGGGGIGLVPTSNAGTLISTGTGSFNGSAQGGASVPLRTVQPTIITNYIIYAGA